MWAELCPERTELLLPTQTCSGGRDTVLRGPLGHLRQRRLQGGNKSAVHHIMTFRAPHCTFYICGFEFWTLSSSELLQRWFDTTLLDLNQNPTSEELIWPPLQVLTHADFMGLGDDSSSTPVVVAPHPRETFTYIYKTGVYSQCSATCNGGMQYRSVDCWIQDPVNPRVVEETYCITQRLQRPQSQQACNMQPCVAEYSVSSFSAVCISLQRTSLKNFPAWDK